MCVWLSIAPGSTKHPAASITSASTPSKLPTPATVSPSTSTSASNDPDALTTVPPRMIFLIALAPLCSACCDQVDSMADGLRVGPDRELEMLDRRVLLLGVADPVGGRGEQHHGGDEARHLRGVVQRARRQGVVGAADRLARPPGGRDQ